MFLGVRPVMEESGGEQREDNTLELSVNIISQLIIHGVSVAFRISDCCSPSAPSPQLPQQSGGQPSLTPFISSLLIPPVSVFGLPTTVNHRQK